MKTKIFAAFILSVVLIALSGCNNDIQPKTKSETVKSDTEFAASAVNENAEKSAETYAFPFAFTAEDFYGNAVTEASLGEKELFFVHYWGTWCPPCVAEMPELAGVAKEYGERVGFIGLLDDYGSNVSGAINIMDSAGIPQSFIMVDAENKDLQELLSMVKSGYVPTTIIIDKDGNMLGGQLIGVYGEQYGTTLEQLLD